MARPLSELRLAVLEYVRTAGPVTARELAHRMQLGVKVACMHLHRLHLAGRIEVVDRVAMPRMKRLALRYQITAVSIKVKPWSLLDAWPRDADSDEVSNGICSAHDRHTGETRQPRGRA